MRTSVWIVELDLPVGHVNGDAQWAEGCYRLEPRSEN